MVTLSKALPLILDHTYFEKIHSIKSSFIRLFSHLGNRLSSLDLERVHRVYKGIKITKGNELRHCPYQVLDLVRDFDKNNGFNIRVLHWWGRGMFVIIYFGQENPCLVDSHLLPGYFKEKNYRLGCTASPWDYGGMIDEAKTADFIDGPMLAAHQQKFRHIQLIRKIEYETEYALMEETLYEELSTICQLFIKDSG